MRFYLLVPVLLIYSSVSAQCIKGNCRSGKGVYKYQNGATYSGDFQQGKPHGIGTLIFANGNKYVGQWSQSFRQGEGKMIFASGEEYEGQFVASRFDGYGTYRFSNGNAYEGYWKNSKPNGQGTLKKKQEADVSGMWQDGKLVENAGDAPERVVYEELPDCNLTDCENGLGRYTYQNGSMYEGEFLNGMPHGQGVCYYVNGDKYTGDWVRHQPNGKGAMVYANGDRLDGMWNEGEFVRGKKLLTNEDKQANKIYAVLVGVSRYEHFKTLKYTDDDAYRIYAFLKSPEGGAIPDDQIHILIDESATKKNITKALQDVMQRADENDAVFCFFSGHGLSGSFLPIDSDGYRNALAYEEVKDYLEQCRAKQKLYIADACYSGSILASRTALSQSLQLFYNKLNETSGGTAFLLSSKPQEYSLESQGLRQGIFSHYLIKGLKGAADTDMNKIVSVSELYNYVYTRVRNYTRQAQSPVLAGRFDEDMPVGVLR